MLWLLKLKCFSYWLALLVFLLKYVNWTLLIWFLVQKNNYRIDKNQVIGAKLGNLTQILSAWFQLDYWNAPAPLDLAWHLFSLALLSLGNFSSNSSPVFTHSGVVSNHSPKFSVLCHSMSIFLELKCIQFPQGWQKLLI